MAAAPDPDAPARGPLILYLCATASWFMAVGVQAVLFAWLVTIALDESPDRVGFAQMTMMLPTLMLLLFAGVVADRFGGVRVALGAQLCAVLPVLGLALAVAADRLSYPALLVYAVAMGTVQAFLTPARDGMLAQVAGARIQRTVVLASLIQFGVQVFGYGVAGMADRIGAVTVLLVQALTLAVGASCFLVLKRQLPPRAGVDQAPAALFDAVTAGMRSVLVTPSMRAVVVINVCIGLFFMGAYLVTMPLLVREVFGGTPGELAMVNGAHVIGIALMMFLLLQYGDIERRGRALIIAMLAGALVLGAMGLVSTFVGLMVLNLVWGCCAGVCMSMGRTIVQEMAPEHQRSRVMAFYSLSFMGAGPVGAVLAGYLVQLLGVHQALLVPAATIGAVVTLVALRSRLWQLTPQPA